VFDFVVGTAGRRSRRIGSVSGGHRTLVAERVGARLLDRRQDWPWYARLDGGPPVQSEIDGSIKLFFLTTAERMSHSTNAF